MESKVQNMFESDPVERGSVDHHASKMLYHIPDPLDWFMLDIDIVQPNISYFDWT